MSHSYRIAFFTKSKKRTLYSSYIIFALRRIGCEVRHFNMNAVRRLAGSGLAHRWMKWRVRSFKPDAVIIFSGDIQLETLEDLRGEFKTAIILDDFFPVDAPVTDKIRLVDVFFHTMTGQLEEYKAAGAKRAVYVHSGVDPDWHQPAEPRDEFRSDVAFIGKGEYADRIDFIRGIAESCDLKIYGSRWQRHGLSSWRESVAVKDFQKVCSSAKIVLGYDKSNEMELYFSNRTWFVLGCRGFLLTRYIPKLETIFENHKHLVWYKDLDEAVDQIRHYRTRDDERQRIATAGYRFAHHYYPFDRMARNIVGVLFEGREPDALTPPDAEIPA